MIFEELHNRYGAHVAKRVQLELSASELAQVSLAELPAWLESRAETAHKDYEIKLGNPFDGANGRKHDALDALYRRWQQAEEIAYIIAVAEDVSTQTRAVAGK